MKIKLDEGARMPTRAHSTDAGLDIYSLETKWIHPNEYETFRTGVHIELPACTVGLLTSKSGLMRKHGITNRGTIDEGYIGEIRVILFNHGEEGYLVKAGDKISQLLILPILRPQIELVEELEETERGSDGFGSTGK